MLLHYYEVKRENKVPENLSAMVTQINLHLDPARVFDVIMQITQSYLFFVENHYRSTDK